MIFVSLTRLRIRSLRFVPLFAFDALQSNRQVKKARGFRAGALLPDRHWTFWTITAWDNQESMCAFITSGAHKKAMPRLLHWCDEASVAHWSQLDASLPSWEDADRRMRTSGRISKVLHPSPHHADMSFAAPRTTAATTI